MMLHEVSTLTVLLLTVAAQSHAQSRAQAQRVRPGMWLWNCDGAAYTGAHKHGYYTRLCKQDVFSQKPPELRGALHVFPWAQVEPEDGQFDWSAVDANLTAMAENGVQVSPTVWIHKGSSISGLVPTPEWLFKVSPGIPYQHEKGKGPVLLAPDYLDKTFQQRFTRLIHAFAQHLDALPQNVKDNIWAVEASLGITGDSRPWKGVPVHSNQTISTEQWIDYNHKFTQVYVDAFLKTGIPVIANVENPGYGQIGLEQPRIFIEMAESRGMKNAALKQGTVSHGYNLNGEMDVYSAQALPLLLTPRKDGSYVRSRGELALEPDPGLPGSYGNWVYSPAWSFQANAEWALTYGLDAWNVYAGWLHNASFFETVTFFNRHAGHKDVSKTPAAFISFRDSLDTSDTKRFPVEKYGQVNDTKTPDSKANAERMSKIVRDFAAFGAKLEDPDEAADKRSVIQKKGNYLCDVCWRCWPTNYGRFISQVRPVETSVGWWQQGPRDQAYGRFARGLHHATNRTKITMHLEKGLSIVNAKVSIVFLDRGRGKWSLGVNGKAVLTETLTHTERWRTLTTASLAHIKAGDELTLWSPDNTDVIFSLLEIYAE